MVEGGLKDRAATGADAVDLHADIALEAKREHVGRGKIDGRPVVVSGDDFTVRGGSADFSGKRKQEVAEQMALELRLVGEVSASADTREGVSAFIEKRQAQWSDS